MQKLQDALVVLKDRLLLVKRAYVILTKQLKETDNEVVAEAIADKLADIDIEVIPTLENEIETLKEAMMIIKKWTE